MNHKLFTTLSGLSIISALLVVGLIPGGHAGRMADGASGGVVETVESGVVEAADEMADEVAPAPRKHRRGRASLSMPYFSFAQSLRPQG